MSSLIEKISSRAQVAQYQYFYYLRNKEEWKNKESLLLKELNQQLDWLSEQKEMSDYDAYSKQYVKEMEKEIQSIIDEIKNLKWKIKRFSHIEKEHLECQKLLKSYGLKPEELSSKHLQIKEMIETTYLSIDRENLQRKEIISLNQRIANLTK